MSGFWYSDPHRQQHLGSAKTWLTRLLCDSPVNLPSEKWDDYKPSGFQHETFISLGVL